jgi:hypothetical protein
MPSFKQDVDARDKRGHDGTISLMFPNTTNPVPLDSLGVARIFACGLMPYVWYCAI